MEERYKIIKKLRGKKVENNVVCENIEAYFAKRILESLNSQYNTFGESYKLELDNRKEK